MGAFVMFVSHQWNGFNHPDPHGRQMQVLTASLRALRDGVHKKVETTPFHVLIYKENVITNASEWKELLSNAYIWYDWFSQPQPFCAKNKTQAARLQNNLNSALNSVAAYIERSDTLLILAPSCIHDDLIDKQTGRKRIHA